MCRDQPRQLHRPSADTRTVTTTSDGHRTRVPPRPSPGRGAASVRESEGGRCPPADRRDCRVTGPPVPVPTQGSPTPTTQPGTGRTGHLASWDSRLPAGYATAASACGALPTDLASTIPAGPGTGWPTTAAASADCCRSRCHLAVRQTPEVPEGGVADQASGIPPDVVVLDLRARRCSGDLRPGGTPATAAGRHPSSRGRGFAGATGLNR